MPVPALRPAVLCAGAIPRRPTAERRLEPRPETSEANGVQNLLAEKALRRGERADAPVNQNRAGRKIDVSDAQRPKIGIVDDLRVPQGDARDEGVVVGEEIVNLKGLICLEHRDGPDMALGRERPSANRSVNFYNKKI